MPSVVFRKGLDLGPAVASELAEDYRSALVEQVKAADYTHQAGRLTVHLAREFGFCYGVDRAVDYAYQTRRRFPDRRVFLTGEIIHNPHVNGKLRASGVRFLDDPGETIEALRSDDVVILPAFGVTVSMLTRLDRQGCTLVDTTCGSVLNVWKAVRRYAEDGFTSVIHGKVRHEETQATASQALKPPRGPFLVVLDRAEAAEVCRYIREGGDRAAFLARFAGAYSDGFDPDRDLARVGLANQTTMLKSESLAVGEMFRAAMADRYGLGDLAGHYRAFDTICSATQDRQDAVLSLLRDRPIDLMVVIGGYNSSNTLNLARLCAGRVPTFHVADDECLESPDAIRHRPVGEREEVRARGWLPPAGPIHVGLTAGASTPDNIVGAAILKLAVFAAASSAAR
ncbi:MAG TPA: 4-hydroxy-3-methylbut-2-enyl diphosphate reductase [Vicinamibacterales bacterium]|nr:4-hydroxy-3-methylbut-2-enyl diphosphate reductase [Vicinamibacterales bacterium]